MKPDWDMAIEEAARYCERHPNVPGKYLGDRIRSMLLAPAGVNARLARIERLLIELTGVELREENIIMATSETVARLVADVKANTDATAATKQALEHYAQSNADLTAQLQAAIANNDEAAISAAASALEKNNTDLLAAVPQVAAAVVDNTPAAPPAPPADAGGGAPAAPPAAPAQTADPATPPATPPDAGSVQL